MNAFHKDPGPLVVNFGGGVDSTAVLVGLARLVRAGDTTARPTLILFADTGDELPETYDNVRRVSAWCERIGFPAVTVVSRSTEIRGRTSYRSLSENCLANETLPSEAFGRGACSSKWKHEPMTAFLFGRKRPKRQGWLDANGWTGTVPTRLIGYDATETASGKRGKWAKVDQGFDGRYRYPLVEWGWTRDDCKEAIAAEGLQVPIKSACFMCPNQSEEELRRMANNHPGLFLRALAIEHIAEHGRHGLTKLEGLWRRTRKRDGREGSWRAWAERNGYRAVAEHLAGITLVQVIAEHQTQGAAR